VWTLNARKEVVPAIVVKDKRKPQKRNGENENGNWNDWMNVAILECLVSLWAEGTNHITAKHRPTATQICRNSRIKMTYFRC
jgi:hypothetical protein